MNKLFHYGCIMTYCIYLSDDIMICIYHRALCNNAVIINSICHYLLISSNMNGYLSDRIILHDNLISFPISTYTVDHVASMLFETTIQWTFAIIRFVIDDKPVKNAYQAPTSSRLLCQPSLKIQKRCNTVVFDNN